MGQRRFHSGGKEEIHELAGAFRVLATFHDGHGIGDADRGAIIAFCAGGRLGLKFATLYGTYKRWPQNKKLEGLILEKFSKVEFEQDLMGGAIMVAAYK